MKVVLELPITTSSSTWITLKLLEIFKYQVLLKVLISEVLEVVLELLTEYLDPSLVSGPALEIFKNEIRNKGKKARARRYTDEWPYSFMRSIIVILDVRTVEVPNCRILLSTHLFLFSRGTEFSFTFSNINSLSYVAFQIVALSLKSHNFLERNGGFLSQVVAHH